MAYAMGDSAAVDEDAFLRYFLMVSACYPTERENGFRQIVSLVGPVSTAKNVNVEGLVNDLAEKIRQRKKGAENDGTTLKRVFK